MMNKETGKTGTRGRYGLRHDSREPAGIGVTSSRLPPVPSISLSIGSINKEVVNAVQTQGRLARVYEEISKGSGTDDLQGIEKTVRLLAQRRRKHVRSYEPEIRHAVENARVGVQSASIGEFERGKGFGDTNLPTVVGEQGRPEMEVKPPNTPEGRPHVSNGESDRISPEGVPFVRSGARTIVHPGDRQRTSGGGYEAADVGGRESITSLWQIADRRQRTQRWKVGLNEIEQGEHTRDNRVSEAPKTTTERVNSQGVLDNNGSIRTSTDNLSAAKETLPGDIERGEPEDKDARSKSIVRSSTTLETHPDRDDSETTPARFDKHIVQKLHRDNGRRVRRSVGEVESFRADPDRNSNEIILSTEKLTGTKSKEIDFLIDLADPNREWVSILSVNYHICSGDEAASISKWMGGGT